MSSDLWLHLLAYLDQVFVKSFDGWAVIGYIGQIFFFMRFGVQWYASERAGRSIIPLSFWYLSIGGCLLLLAYGISRREPIIILGQGPNVLIYIRNLMLIAKENKKREL